MELCRKTEIPVNGNLQHQKSTSLDNENTIKADMEYFSNGVIRNEDIFQEFGDSIKDVVDKNV